MKVCTTCRGEKASEAFSRSQTSCKPCRTEYTRRWNHENRESRQATESRRYAQTRDVIGEAKARPCADCGTSFPPYVMDFDHVTGTKLFNIGSASGISAERLMAEIAKCDVVCANCHRERTHNGRHQAP